MQQSLKGKRKTSRVWQAVNEARLWRRHIELSEIGKTSNGGVSRFPLSREDILAKRLLIAWAQELRLEIGMDEIGNLFFPLYPGMLRSPSVIKE